MKTNIRFFITCLSVLLTMRNVSDKTRRENQNTHFVFNNLFPENLVLYDIWKNILQSDRSQMTKWRLRIACWIPKATNTHSEYVIRIAFPLQQQLHEFATTLRRTYIACPVIK